MADYTTEMDCVRTFLLKVHTAATTKHFTEIKNISLISDDKRILVLPPEPIGSDGDDFYWMRFGLLLSEPGEATMTTALNNILIGIKKFNKRAAITGWVYASAPKMCHMKYANGNAAHEDPISKRWDRKISIDVEFSTS